MQCMDAKIQVLDNFRHTRRMCLYLHANLLSSYKTSPEIKTWPMGTVQLHKSIQSLHTPTYVRSHGTHTHSTYEPAQRTRF